MTNKDQYKIGIISEHAQGMVTSKLESLASVHKQQFSVFFAMQLMATLKKKLKKNQYLYCTCSNKVCRHLVCPHPNPNCVYPLSELHYQFLIID